MLKFHTMFIVTSAILRRRLRHREKKHFLTIVFSSVMHYKMTPLKKSGKRVVAFYPTKKAGQKWSRDQLKCVGQREHAEASDVDKVRCKYGCDACGP